MTITQPTVVQPTVVIYTASYCPYCTQAKALLAQKNILFEEIDVTDPHRRAEMTERTKGRKTVPQIFIGQIHVGGFDDLRALDQTKQLDQLLNR
jgi:glutaredoxin 3